MYLLVAAGISFLDKQTFNNPKLVKGPCLSFSRNLLAKGMKLLVTQLGDRLTVLTKGLNP